MKVRFILGWQLYKPGDIIEPNGVLRQWLLESGYVEIVKEPEAELETATVGPTEHAALRINAPVSRRKRGRPRKMPS